MLWTPMVMVTGDRWSLGTRLMIDDSSKKVRTWVSARDEFSPTLHVGRTRILTQLKSFFAVLYT
jgi:hypothetical protein